MVCVLSSFFYSSIACILVHDDTQIEHLCQAGSAVGVPLEPSHLPRLVYAHGPDGFAREHEVGCNTNFMGYPFPMGIRAVISLSFFLLCLSFLVPLNHLL